MKFKDLTKSAKIAIISSSSLVLVGGLSAVLISPMMISDSSIIEVQENLTYSINNNSELLIKNQGDEMELENNFFYDDFKNNYLPISNQVLDSEHYEGYGESLDGQIRPWLDGWVMNEFTSKPNQEWEEHLGDYLISIYGEYDGEETYYGYAQNMILVDDSKEHYVSEAMIVKYGYYEFFFFNFEEGSNITLSDGSVHYWTTEPSWIGKEDDYIYDMGQEYWEEIAFDHLMMILGEYE